MEELEQQPRKELRFLWELREFKILFKRSTAAALPVTWLSQNKPHQINPRAERFQNMRWQRTCISLPGAIANRDRFFVSQKFWNSGQTGYIMSFLVLYQFLSLLKILSVPFFQVEHKNIVTIQAISRKSTWKVAIVQKV